MLEVTNELKTLISEKENLIETLNKQLRELQKLETENLTETNKILTETNWSEVIDGRVTEKAKTAIVEKQLSEKINNVEILKLKIAETKRDIELINDKISLCKLIIREMEICK